MTRPALSLRRFGVAFGTQVVLKNVAFDAAIGAPTVLVGPAGTGKSALLRTLAGLNDTRPSLRTWGDVRGPHERPPRIALVVQDTRFLLATVRENLVSALPNRSALGPQEQTSRARVVLHSAACEDLAIALESPAVDLPLAAQRRLAIVRAYVTDAEVILLDEPTAGLDEASAGDVVELTRRIAIKRAVVVSTHRQDHARRLGGTIVVLAGGRVHEQTGVREFFARPESTAGREWLETGTCSEPGPTSTAEDLAPGVAFPTPLPPALMRTVAAARGPRDFYWLLPGRLGGLPRPGVVAPLTEDLEALRRLGVTTLLTLEETLTVPEAALTAAGIRALHHPIPDGHPPTLAEARTICLELDRRLESGEVVAVHCLAGLGRTGTVLAAYLVHRGGEPREALETVRAARPRAVQTPEQAEFLTAFARAVAGKGRDVQPGRDSASETR